MKRYYLLVVVFSILQCQALINFKVPPFTITNAQTAAEKQMVGEDRDLEKDGWLVSSIQSSSGANSMPKSTGQNEQGDSELSGHLLRLNYLSPEVKRYKLHGIIGEGLGGILKLNLQASISPFYLQYESPAKKKRVEDVISLINESRKIVIDKQVEGEKRKGKKDEELKIYKQSLVDGYQKSVTKGEFFESSVGKWERL
jgi:hypothetical protein